MRTRQCVVLEHDDAPDHVKAARMERPQQLRQIGRMHDRARRMTRRTGHFAREAAIRRDAAVALHVDDERVDRGRALQRERGVAQRVVRDTVRRQVNRFRTHRRQPDRMGGVGRRQRELGARVAGRAHAHARTCRIELQRKRAVAIRGPVHAAGMADRAGQRMAVGRIDHGDRHRRRLRGDRGEQYEQTRDHALNHGFLRRFSAVRSCSACRTRRSSDSAAAPSRNRCAGPGAHRS